jgi:hypothetical protein
MGTRSLTLVFDSDGEQLLNIYRHFDGYPSGHGKDLADFLSTFTVGNGIRGDEKGKFANGMPCLAAQLVSHLKYGPGGIYIYPRDLRDVWEDYIYEVHQSGSSVRLVCRHSGENGKRLFDGLACDFNAEKIEQSEQAA